MLHDSAGQAFSTSSAFAELPGPYCSSTWAQICRPNIRPSVPTRCATSTVALEDWTRLLLNLKYQLYVYVMKIRIGMIAAGGVINVASIFLFFQIARVPWSSILTSLPVWSLIIVHSGSNWGFYTLLTEMPTYMKSILNFDVQKVINIRY